MSPVLIEEIPFSKDFLFRQGNRWVRRPTHRQRYRPEMPDEASGAPGTPHSTFSHYARSRVRELGRVSDSRQRQTDTCPLFRFSEAARSNFGPSRGCRERKAHIIVTKMNHTMSWRLPDEIPFSKDFLFRQLFDRESCTYTYLLADINNQTAVIIDPVIECFDRDVAIIQNMRLKLKYAMNTHVHADHITGTGKLKSAFTDCQSMISRASGAVADVLLNHYDEINFGKHSLQVIPTPGHTQGCVTYVCHQQGIAFTGDALLIRGCGRTDFQGGSAVDLYRSVRTQIFTLPENYKLYPAHDYNGRTVTTVAEEMAFNPRLTKSENEFISIMNNLNLPYPKMIDEAVPINKVCGLYELLPLEKPSVDEVSHDVSDVNPPSGR
ncbi:persulfide dioxygenase ETHE1, mitochondrial isoform X2 [Colletes gigas]|uniref:persulfide dioxygenase ETHE1, mitochondrial isoform X2 n=1 Tax=Colletes gigas TaxID=935657 RepID=UPI001C9B97A6|nr:persulfide dioxygenase ETHE1, mitochondrial isoform X2 [Colletes gigas]